MAKARDIPEEGLVHVMNRGNNKRKLFFCLKDYKTFLKFALLFKHSENIKIYHYVLMPNHVHFMVNLDDKSNLAKFMQKLSLTYFNYFKKRHQCVGHLWQGRFKSKVIEDEAYYLRCGKYIEYNPVRAGLTRQPEEYLFSSYRFYLLAKEDALVDIDPFYAKIGLNIDERREFYGRILVDDKTKNQLDWAQDNDKAKVESDLLQDI